MALKSGKDVSRLCVLAGEKTMVWAERDGRNRDERKARIVIGPQSTTQQTWSRLGRVVPDRVWDGWTIQIART